MQEYKLAKMELIYTIAYIDDHPEALRLLEEIYERESEFNDD